MSLMEAFKRGWKDARDEDSCECGCGTPVVGWDELRRLFGADDEEWEE